MPETKAELAELAITSDAETGIYGLSNGLLIQWSKEGARRVGRWDPRLPKPTAASKSQSPSAPLRFSPLAVHQAQPGPIVEQFNPHHDARGRFAPTSSTGASSKTGGSPSQGGATGEHLALQSDAEAKQFLGSHYGSWRKAMSAKEDAAMTFYQSPGYELMNGQLRGHEVKAPAKDLARAKEASKNLKQAIDKAPPLRQSMTVWRGFSAEQFGKLESGKIVQDKGFVSTALTREQAGSFVSRGSQAIAKITLPAGTKAAGGSVKEMVLSPNSRFRVVSAVKKGKLTEVEMELLP